MPALIDENQSFQDVNGKPIVNGFIYVGLQDTDTKANLIDIFSNRELTIALANPQRTDDFGKSVNKVWVPGRHSLLVEDENNVQKLTDPDSGELPAIGNTSLSNVQEVSNAITANAIPAITSYVDHQQFVFTATADNTGAVTLNIDGVGVRDIRDVNGGVLAVRSITVGDITNIFYNAAGDFFQITAVVGSGFSVGAILDYGGATAPQGAVFCDGSTFNSVSDTSFANLFDVIGTFYGGTGPSNFQVPDYRGRISIALDNLGGTSANRIVNAQADILGGSGGAETATLTTAELPAHTHTGPSHFHNIQGFDNTISGPNKVGIDRNNNGVNQNTDAAGTGATGSTGSGNAFDKTQPWLAVGKIIIK